MNFSLIIKLLLFCIYNFVITVDTTRSVRFPRGRLIENPNLKDVRGYPESVINAYTDDTTTNQVKKRKKKSKKLKQNPEISEEDLPDNPETQTPYSEETTTKHVKKRKKRGKKLKQKPKISEEDLPVTRKQWKKKKNRRSSMVSETGQDRRDLKKPVEIIVRINME